MNAAGEVEFMASSVWETGGWTLEGAFDGCVPAVDGSYIIGLAAQVEFDCHYESLYEDGNDTTTVGGDEATEGAITVLEVRQGCLVVEVDTDISLGCVAMPTRIAVPVVE